MKNKFPIRSILIVAVAAQVLLLGIALSVRADTYSWTDSAGAIHFTDDPRKAPEKARRAEIDPAETSHEGIPDVVGRWSNPKSSYDAFSVAFFGDRTGEMITANGQHIRFDWLVRTDGQIKLELRESPERGRYGQRSRTYTLFVTYDREQDAITVTDETKQRKLGTLYPEDEGQREQKQPRIHAPRRLTFAEKTVRDTLTGLTWTRDLNLPGSLRRHRNAVQFLMELNDRGYGDIVDWRLPTVGEMQELLRTLQDFGRQSGRSTSPGTPPELLRWVGFSNPKGRCYWTSTEGEGTGERYAYSLEDEDQHSFGHQQTCGIWPVRGNRK